jgi:lipoate-protein ligase A
MFRALRIPIEKLKDKELESVRERVTCMNWELGYLQSLEQIKKALKRGFEEVFNIELEQREISSDEKKLFDKKLKNFQSDKWIYGVRRPIEHRQVLTSIYKAQGGLIRISLVADIPNKRIQAALITGDFFSHPKRAILDLEGLMKDSVLDKNDLEKLIFNFFSERDVQIPGVTPEDFINAIHKALDKINYIKLGIPIESVNRVFTVIKPINEITYPPVLLLPYCSKLVECELRHKNECTKCSLCTIGDAYESAEKNKMKPITILSFENLMETLHNLKKNGVKTFIGSCCEAFYIKHLEDFEEAGLPGVLVDIDSTTCYDLEKVKEAELGSFEGQTYLNMDLINKVIEVLKSRN